MSDNGLQYIVRLISLSGNDGVRGNGHSCELVVVATLCLVSWRCRNDVFTAEDCHLCGQQTGKLYGMLVWVSLALNSSGCVLLGCCLHKPSEVADLHNVGLLSMLQQVCLGYAAT